MSQLYMRRWIVSSRDDVPATKKNYYKMSKPWWSDECTELNKKVHQAEKLWRDLKKHNKPCKQEHNNCVAAQKLFNRGPDD